MKRIFAITLLLAVHLSANAQAIVAHVAGNGTTPSAPADMTGAKLIGICGWDNIVPTDSCGNTYTKLNSVGFGNELDLWGVFNPISTSCISTMTFNANNANNAISVVGVSGIAGGPDQTAIGATGTDVLTVNPTRTHELILSCGVNENGGTTLTNSTLTNLDTANDNPALRFTTAAYHINGATTAPGVSTWSASWGNGNATTANSFYSTADPAPLVATNANPLTELVAGAGGDIPLTATGGVQPYTWTPNAGTLPSGCSLIAQHIHCASTVTAAITTGLKFQVTDSTSTTALTPSLTLPIAAQALSLGAASCATTGAQYVAYPNGCSLFSLGGIPPIAYSYTKGFGPRDTSPYAAIPPGLTLNPSTGAITGTNYGQGYYGTQYLATDAYGATATFVVTVQLAGSNAWMAKVFPTDSIFRIKVTSLPLAAPGLSDISTYASFVPQMLFGQGPNNIGLPNGIPIIHVPSSQPNVTVATVGGGLFSFNSGPVPLYMPVEQTSNNANPNCCYPGDAHGSVTLLDSLGNPMGLYDMWQAAYNGSIWQDQSNAAWTNVQSSGSGAYVMLPPEHGAPNLAGIPMGPLILNADEVIGTGTPTAPNGVVRHPTYATINNVLAFHVSPAVASAGAGIGGCTGNPYVDPTTSNLLNQANPPTSCTPIPIPGMTYRLKASFTLPGCAATSPQASIIFQGWKDYGITFGDIGSFFAIIGTPDSRWVDTDIACNTHVTLGDFEAVNTQASMVLWPGNDSPSHIGSTQVTGGTPSTGKTVNGKVTRKGRVH